MSCTRTGLSREKTCIDCHKRIAHRLPDMSDVPGWQ
jgi:cytochrome c-type protein NapC